MSRPPDGDEEHRRGVPDDHLEDSGGHSEHAPVGSATGSEDQDDGHSDREHDQADALKGLRQQAEPRTRAEEARRDQLLGARFEQMSGLHIHTVGNLAFVQGNDTIGSFTMGSGGEKTRGYADLGTTLAGHTTCYVPPSLFEEALKRLTDLHLLILTAPPDTGRTAAALNLLASCGGEKAAVHQVLSTAVLLEEDWAPPTENAGYLLDLGGGRASGSGPDAESIGEWWIDRVTARLRSAGCRMVVLTGPARGLLARTAVRSSQVMDTLGDLDRKEVFVRHVLGADPDPDERSALLRRLSEAGGVLGDRAAPRDAVRYAEAEKRGDLAAEARRDPDLVQRLRGWLSGDPDPADVCFLLATAFLEGAGYLTVSDAAVALHSMLEPDQEEQRMLRFSSWLDGGHPWIEVLPPRGAGTAVRVVFRDPLLQPLVLEHFWHRLDAGRSALVRWARRLVVHPDVEVRVRAAIAISIFSRHDPDHALHTYLRPWARANDQRIREAAAYALTLLGGDPGLTDKIWAELDAWTDEASTSPRLWTTAATVAGSPFGAGRPEDALQIVRRALDTGWNGLVTVTAALHRLIDLEREDEVLRALLAWTSREAEPEVAEQALVAFVFASFRPVRWANEGARPGLPFVLADAGRSRRRLSVLLGRALADETARDHALEVLHTCLAEHGEDTASLHCLRDLLLAVASLSSRQHRRLSWHLGVWAEEGFTGAAAARAIHTALNSRVDEDVR